jgi:transcriptional regulator with PAS, ATPase and Fis domain
MIRISEETAAEEIEKINALLQKAGIRIVKDSSLSLEIDLAAYGRMTSREAGRPYKPLKENGYLAHVTKKEIRDRMKKETAQQIAVSLGISRRTLFRRLKETMDDDGELL